LAEVAEQTRLATSSANDRLVRRASLLELLPVALAPDDDRALRRDHEKIRLGTAVVVLPL